MFVQQLKKRSTLLQRRAQLNTVSVVQSLALQKKIAKKVLGA